METLGSDEIWGAGVVIWKGTEIGCGIFLFFPRYVKFRIGDEIKEQH